MRHAICQTSDHSFFVFEGDKTRVVYHVERYLRESLIPRTAPVSPHMILNFLAGKVLGLPKSC